MQCWHKGRRTNSTCQQHGWGSAAGWRRAPAALQVGSGSGRHQGASQQRLALIECRDPQQHHQQGVEHVLEGGGRVCSQAGAREGPLDLSAVQVRVGATAGWRPLCRTHRRGSTGQATKGNLQKERSTISHPQPPRIWHTEDASRGAAPGGWPQGKLAPGAGPPRPEASPEVRSTATSEASTNARKANR